MDVTLEELNDTEVELLEQIKNMDIHDKLKNRLVNKTKNCFRLHRAMLKLYQQTQRRK
jgi:hypothetical protein